MIAARSCKLIYVYVCACVRACVHVCVCACQNIYESMHSVLSYAAVCCSVLHRVAEFYIVL